MKLIVGNYNYSSWSLRAWLYLIESGLDFELVRIALFTGDWKQQIKKYSPAGRVPVLIDGDETIWDSMAIIDHCRERYAELAVAWPASAGAASLARSISYEMHSGFLALRDELPQNLRAQDSLDSTTLSDECRQQVHRIDTIWCDAMARFGGDDGWLFGDFSIADVMFAPVALRFATYRIELSPPAQRYVETTQSLPAVRRWIDWASEESESLDFVDQRMLASETPLVLG